MLLIRHHGRGSITAVDFLILKILNTRACKKRLLRSLLTPPYGLQYRLTNPTYIAVLSYNHSGVRRGSIVKV